MAFKNKKKFTKAEQERKNWNGRAQKNWRKKYWVDYPVNWPVFFCPRFFGLCAQQAHNKLRGEGRRNRAKWDVLILFMAEIVVERAPDEKVSLEGTFLSFFFSSFFFQRHDHSFLLSSIFLLFPSFLPIVSHFIPLLFHSSYFFPPFLPLPHNTSSLPSWPSFLIFLSFFSFFLSFLPLSSNPFIDHLASGIFKSHH